MEKENLCFWGNKRVFASIHSPKGRKRGHGIVSSLLNLLYITSYLAIENTNERKRLNHQKQPILNQEKKSI